MKLSVVAVAVSSLIPVLAQANDKAVYLDEIVVEGNKITQPLSDVAGSVVVVQGDEMERKGTTELYDALRNEPGVTVTGSAGRPQNIIIRGMTGNRVAVIKDGIRSSDGYGANDINDQAGRNSFDLSNIDSLEVVKGAGSSIHGSGAVGGALIIKSKKPGDYLDEKDFYADIGTTYTGVSDKTKLSSTMAYRYGKSEHLVNLSGWRGNESQNYNNELYDRDLEGSNVSYTLNYFLSDETMLKGQIESYAENQTRKDGPASIQPDGKWKIKSFDEDETMSTLSGFVGAELTPFSSAWYSELDTQMYWRNTELEENTNRLMSKPDQNNILELRRELEAKTFSDNTIGLRADIQSEQEWGRLKHSLAYGFDLSMSEYERTNRDKTFDSNGVSHTQKLPFSPATGYSAGIYLRDVFEINNWEFISGLRLDGHKLTAKNTNANAYQVNDIDSHELSPNLSVGYKFFGNLKTYLSYNHGYRAPTYDKAYGYVLHDFVPITPFVIVPNKNLRAESSDSYELGVKFDNGRTSVYVAAFYQEFNNFIDVIDTGFDPSKGLFIKQYQNLEGVKTYGMEYSLTHAISERWKLSEKAGFVDGEDANGDYIRTLTPVEGSMSLDYEHNQFSAYVTVNWAAAMNRTPKCSNNFNHKVNCAKTSNWTTLDSGFSYEFDDHWQMSATVINLFDRKYIRYQDVAGISSSHKHYYSEPGRYFTFNVKYRL